MKFGLISTVLFALLPLAALADDTANMSGQAQAPQSAVGASDLLPQTGTVSGGASSTGAGTSLQPGASSLQGSSGDGSSLSAPADQVLQAAPASDNLKVMLGSEADGSPQSLTDPANTWGEDLITVAAGILILCGAIAMLRRRVIKGNQLAL